MGAKKSRGSTDWTKFEPPVPQGEESTREGDDLGGSGRKAFEAEKNRTRAIEEAIQQCVPHAHIDFAAARERELQSFESTQCSPLFHEMQRREGQGR